MTNDTFHPLRNFVFPEERKRERAILADGRPGSPDLLRRLRSRTAAGGQPQGRWSLVRHRITVPLTVTQWSANAAQQLLARHGIVMRETALAENIPGGNPSIYPALKTMEENGKIRRGMFVAGLGAAQFGATPAVEMLRTQRLDPEVPEAVCLAAGDPANPYGTILPWPRGQSGEENTSGAHGMSRTRGAGVILVNGTLAAFLRKQNPSIRVFLADGEPERSQLGRALANKLADLAIRWRGKHSGLLIGEINDRPAREHFLAPLLGESGFRDTAQGFQMQRVAPVSPMPSLVEDDEELNEEEGGSESA